VREELQSRHARPRRIEILTKDHGLFEASVLMPDGQALAAYIATRGGSLHLADADVGGERVEQLTIRQNHVIHARPLESDVPVVISVPGEREERAVELTLSGGVMVRGRFPMVPGQSLREHFMAAGAFPVLLGASQLDGTSMGDLAVNQYAIESVRDLGEGTPMPEWTRSNDHGPATAAAAATPAPATSARVHWLLRAARELRLGGCADLVFPPSSSILDAWRDVCSASGLSQDELASALGGHLRMPLADGAELERAVADHPLPQALLNRYRVRVLSADGRTLVIATADPMDADAEQALSFAANRRIEFVLATPQALGLQPVRAEEADLDDLLNASSIAADAVRVDDEYESQEVELDDATAEPVIRLANLILREAIRQRASDIHLEPDDGRGIVRFRVDGILRPYMHVPLSALNRVISRFKITARLDISDRVRPQDGRVRIRVEGRPYELRLSTVPTQDSEKAVIRIAGAVAEQTLEQLGIADTELQRLRQLLSFRDGIVVVTGPTGSGKTTTLYGALNELNTGKVNIMTVEDPIERALAGVTQIQVQPKRGVTFASAMRALLRQDPDVILLGEIRDLETAEIAVQAATTGHLVLTTLHTNSAVGVVARLRDLGLDSHSLSGSLRGIVAQRLARRVCAACAGNGCEGCGGSGYFGRIPLLEVLTATPDFSHLVGRGALYHDLQTAAEADGMRPMRDVAVEAVAAGVTTREEVERVLGDIEREARLQTSLAGGDRPALAAHATSSDLNGDGTALLAAGDVDEGRSNLPARRDTAEEDTPARRRAEQIRALLQGLDRCVADGQATDEVLHFASEQLAAAFEAPLVWVATVENGVPGIRARAGACAPYVRDLLPDWEELETSDGAVATALRTCTPQGSRLDEEAGFEGWREHARAHGLHLFLAVPMVCDGVAIGVIGLHARNMNWLDRQAGNELLNISDRIAAVVQRLQQLAAVDVQLSAFELAADAVFLTDRRGVIQWVNRAFTEMSGYSVADAVGQTPRIMRSDRHDAAFYRAMWDTILSGRPWRGELYNLRSDGTPYVIEQTITPVLDRAGHISHFLSVQRDISERRHREDSVRQLITSDALTGLPNGRALETELAHVATAVAAGAAEGALLLINIGGASAGDESEPDSLMQEVARVLADTLRPGDYLARLGESEFAALLLDTPQEGAVIAAGRLRASVRERIGEERVGMSIGIATIDGSQSARGILAAADAALYGSRSRSSAIIVTAPTGAEATPVGTEWAQRIRDALRDDQFFLHFQPVVRLSSGRISHHDVLLRLHDDDGSTVPARVFITHAETLGLMPQIDRWVVENVMRLLQTSPDLRVSLNLSASTVMNPGFRQFMQRQSRRMAAVGARIIFEVSEAQLVEDLPRMAECMTGLRELGCCFALDNFGVSAASLASLGVLPVDYVKVDGTLIMGIDLDPSRLELTRALATLARALGREVIAGWAERASIVELLPDLGIDMAQGHYFGRPGPELRREPDTPVHAAADATDVRPRLFVAAGHGGTHRVVM
jgi:general secretion pathway protein E